MLEPLHSFAIPITSSVRRTLNFSCSNHTRQIQLLPEYMGRDTTNYWAVFLLFCFCNSAAYPMNPGVVSALVHIEYILLQCSHFLFCAIDTLILSPQRRVGLSSRIVAPADDNAILPQSTCLPTTAAYGCESLVFRWSGLAITILAPADGNAITAQPAGMIIAAAYGCESFIFRWSGLPIIIVSPADGNAITAQPAGMPRAAAYGCEPLISRRRGFFAGSPANDEAVITQPTAMIIPAAYGNEALMFRRILTIPTNSHFISTQSTGLSYRFEMFIFQRVPTIITITPADGDAVFTQPTGTATLRYAA